MYINNLFELHFLMVYYQQIFDLYHVFYMPLSFGVI